MFQQNRTLSIVFYHKHNLTANNNCLCIYIHNQTLTPTSTHTQGNTHMHTNHQLIHITISKLPTLSKTLPLSLSSSFPITLCLALSWFPPPLWQYHCDFHFEQNNPNCIILQLMMMYMTQSLLADFSIRHKKRRFLLLLLRSGPLTATLTLKVAIQFICMTLQPMETCYQLYLISNHVPISVCSLRERGHISKSMYVCVFHDLELLRYVLCCVIERQL